MISLLQGTHEGIEDGGAVTILCGGVGYRVLVNDRDREVITTHKGIGGEVRVYCRTMASENDITIFGFLEYDDRRAFDRLLRVDGVGPATAQRVLSVMDHAKLKSIVSAKGVVALCEVPGIGRKTAEKIIATVKL